MAILKIVFLWLLIAIVCCLPEENKIDCTSKFDDDYQILKRVLSVEIEMVKQNELMEARLSEVNEALEEYQETFDGILKQNSRAMKKMEQQKKDGEKKMTEILSSLTAVIEESFSRIEDIVNETVGKEALNDNQLDSAVAFSVETAHTRDVHSGDVIIYNDVIFDQRNNYNTTTGMFTAPMSGSYIFLVQVSVGSASDSVGAQIKTSEGVLGQGHVYHAGSVSLTGVGILELGDQVWVELSYRSPGSGNILYDTNGHEGLKNSFKGVMVR